jgi:hypothetical protein
MFFPPTPIVLGDIVRNALNAQDMSAEMQFTFYDIFA